MALACAMDAGDPAVADLVERLGASEAWAADRRGCLGEPAARAGARRSTSTPLERLRPAASARFVVPGDEEWPAGLDDLPVRHHSTAGRRADRAVAARARSSGEPGRNDRWPIVGSRAATAYGTGVAADLAADLADAGVTVVSGGAFGIDAAAHRGALAVGGPSVAVVANGVDVAYPPGNARIFEALAARHLLVSELPAGAHPTRVRFLARNRLIAAATGGTVVVEAAVRSGARNTAGWACGAEPPADGRARPGALGGVGGSAPDDAERPGGARDPGGRSAGDESTGVGDLRSAVAQGPKPP